MVDVDTTLERAGRVLCQHWRTEWARAVIGVLEYRPGQGVDTADWEVSVRTGWLIRFCCQSRGVQGARVEMVLVLPTAVQRKTTGPVFPLGERVSWWCRFSRVDIEMAARRMGDHNPLHYGERPVVGGFLLLRRLLTAYPGKAQYRLRCRHPILADDIVGVIEQDTVVRGYCRDVCVFELTWEV